jgi:hypothetical protein
MDILSPRSVAQRRRRARECAMRDTLNGTIEHGVDEHSTVDSPECSTQNLSTICRAFPHNQTARLVRPQNRRLSVRWHNVVIERENELQALQRLLTQDLARPGKRGLSCSARSPFVTVRDPSFVLYSILMHFPSVVSQWTFVVC